MARYKFTAVVTGTVETWQAGELEIGKDIIQRLRYGASLHLLYVKPDFYGIRELERLKDEPANPR